MKNRPVLNLKENTSGGGGEGTSKWENSARCKYEMDILGRTNRRGE